MVRTVLIIGGTGSLGKQLIEQYYENNNIVNFSRDELKQYDLEKQFPKVINIIGDIGNYKDVERCILMYKPTHIISAAALKQIDRCEFNIEKTLHTNFQGIKNVCDVVMNHNEKLPMLECICYVSTDKACSPISTYGYSKALGEKYVSYVSKHLHCKCVSVRYGNVLNSRGSIIPLLHYIGENTKDNFKLTHEDMTRFLMTLSDSVKLINYAMDEGVTGEIVIPVLKSMKIKDLLEWFAKKFDREVETTGIRFCEKIHEELINHSESISVYSKNGYYHIRPFNDEGKKLTEFMSYNSNSPGFVLTKEELRLYLIGNHIIQE